MNRSSVTYEPEEGDMEFSEYDRKIIGSKVAKATFKGGVSRLKGKGGEKRNYLVKPGNRLDVRAILRDNND